MKRIFLTTLITSLSLIPIFAYSGTCFNNGERAREACLELNGFANLCLRGIGNSHADDQAVEVCMDNSHTPDNLKFDCIVKGAKNKMFTEAEISLCVNKKSFNKISCIMNKGKKIVRNNQTVFNRGEYAHQSCNELNGFSSLCHKAVGVKHVDEGAVDVCMDSAHAPDNLRYDCIRKAASKTYSDRELTRCLGKSSYLQQIPCIMNSGRVVIRPRCN